MNANKTDKSLAIVTTGMLEVKIIASFSWKAINIKENRSPTAREVKTATEVANFAPLALLAPNSFATRTLDNEEII